MFIGIKLSSGEYAYVHPNHVNCVLQAEHGNGCYVQLTNGKSYFTEESVLELIKKIEEEIEKLQN